VTSLTDLLAAFLPNLLAVASRNAKQPKPGDWSFGWSAVGLIGAASLLVIMLIWLAIRSYQARQRRERHSPWRLFSDLCRTHHLSRRHRHILKCLAVQYQLEQPAMLFVEPKWWEADQLGPTWAPHLPELNRLRLRLFSRR
jgi:hypothetical protein